MPIYEYHCHECGRQSSLFFRTFSAVVSKQCPHCNGNSLERLVSRVSVLKSWGQSLNWMPSGESLYDVDEDNPQAMEAWLRNTRHQMGTELDDSFADTLTKMDAGIAPPFFDGTATNAGSEEA